MEYNNPKKGSKIRELIRLLVFSFPLFKTKNSKEGVLDLGCGWGYYQRTINPLAYGIDMDEACIKYLKSLGYKAILGDITKNLPFKDNTFQWVVCHDVLEHLNIEETKKIIEEVRRILTKDGRFLIIVPNKKGYDFGVRVNAGHKHFLTPEKISNISKKDFSTEKVFCLPFSNFIGKYFVYNKEAIILKNNK